MKHKNTYGIFKNKWKSSWKLKLKFLKITYRFFPKFYGFQTRL